jgi:hypothetical protein
VRISAVVARGKGHRTGAVVASSRWPVPLLLAIGSLGLALGALVYATDRDSAHAMLFPAFATLATDPLFGAVGPWLPSFIHPFAFSLLTAAAVRRSTSPAYGACAAWWAVNMVFEFAQHPQLSGPFAESVKALFGQTWLSRALSNYALRGSFHVDDLVAATAGALAAAGVLALVHRQEIRHESG